MADHRTSIRGAMTSMQDPTPRPHNHRARSPLRPSQGWGHADVNRRPWCIFRQVLQEMLEAARLVMLAQRRDGALV